MLAVDSNFTNADIDSLVSQFGKLAADAATFVTAPTQTVDGSLVPNATARRSALDRGQERLDRRLRHDEPVDRDSASCAMI